MLALIGTRIPFNLLFSWVAQEQQQPALGTPAAVVMEAAVVAGETPPSTSTDALEDTAESMSSLEVVVPEVAYVDDGGVGAANIAEDHERVEGLMQRVDALIASFEDLSSGDEENQQTTTNTVAAVPHLMIPSSSLLCTEESPLTPEPPSYAAADSTTANLVLTLPAVQAAPVPAAEAATPAASGGASQVLALTADELEAVERPLSSQSSNEVTDHIRDIGNILNKV